MASVSNTRQTSIRISASAREALYRICARRAQKVEPTVRYLLQSYIDFQCVQVEDRRLTHISTVLSYPFSTKLPGGPARPTRLAIRITEQMQAAAEQHAYRVPGHAARQSHRDYASRPLGDAVVTAIALEEPFQEPGLVGLPPLIEHRQGDGLWRLVTAASSTGEERRALSGGRTEVKEMILDGEIMWHSPSRTALAVHMAKKLFIGPEAETTLKWVGEQQQEFQDWVENLRDPRTIYGGHDFTEGAPAPSGSSEGRAATALWRCNRILSHDAVAAWLISEEPAPSLVVEPPGWRLALPPTWHALRFPRSSPIPPALRLHLDQGKVLRIDHRRHSALWPLTGSGTPIPGFEHIIRGAGAMQLASLAEAVLVTTDIDETSEAAPINFPRVDVNLAYSVGLVDQDERDQIIKQANEATHNAIQQCLKRARAARWPHYDLARLEAAAPSPAAFLKVAAEGFLQFWITHPNWTWEIRSVPAALAACPQPTEQQLELLGREWTRQVKLALERDMQSAWHQAMWHYRAQDVDQTAPGFVDL